MSSGVTIRLAFLQATNASAKSVITIALWRLLFTSYTWSAMRNLEIKSRIPKKRQLQDSTAGPIASSKKLQAMKRASQSRDRKLVAKGGAVDEMFLIHPDLVKGAKVVWPADD